LKDVINKNGGHSVAFGERVQLSSPVAKTLMKAIGSPNYFTHDVLCRGSVRTATNSLFGYTVTQMNPDYKNTKHIILYGRNLFETIEVKAVKNLMHALDHWDPIRGLSVCVRGETGKSILTDAPRHSRRGGGWLFFERIGLFKL